MRASVQRKVFISVSRHNFARTAASDALLGPQHPIFECYSDKRQKKKNSRHWHLKVRKKYWLRAFFICAEHETFVIELFSSPLTLTYLPNKRWEYCLLNLLKLSSFQIAVFLCSTSELWTENKSIVFHWKFQLES